MSRAEKETRVWATKASAARPSTAMLARANRHRATDAEQALWRHLRHVEFEGSHFRRQVVVGRFIADFACHAAKLVIEVDGGQHSESVGDHARTLELNSLGWRVIRFWNNEVLNNLEGVSIRIAEALAESRGGSFGATPTPNPSPQGGGEAGAVAPPVG